MVGLTQRWEYLRVGEEVKDKGWKHSRMPRSELLNW